MNWAFTVLVLWEPREQTASSRNTHLKYPRMVKTLKLWRIRTIPPKSRSGRATRMMIPGNTIASTDTMVNQFKLDTWRSFQLNQTTIALVLELNFMVSERLKIQKWQLLSRRTSGLNLHQDADAISTHLEQIVLVVTMAVANAANPTTNNAYNAVSQTDVVIHVKKK